MWWVVSTKMQFFHFKTPFCSCVYGVIYCWALAWFSQNLMDWLDIYWPPLSNFKYFILISYLSFHKGFARLKHWKHIKFSLEEINCNESKVNIYECCELNISIHRFCLHGTTIVRIYEFKCNFNSKITTLRKWDFVLFINNKLLKSCGIDLCRGKFFTNGI